VDGGESRELASRKDVNASPPGVAIYESSAWRPRVEDDKMSTFTTHHTATPSRVPLLLNTAETAALLRTSKKAIWAMVERGQLPGVVRIGRRVLVREDALLDWLGQKSTPSPESRQR
jgi:excisionase family DNA binding protein